MITTARFPSSCAFCAKAIDVGSTIDWTETRTIHLACLDEVELGPISEKVQGSREEARREVERLTPLLTHPQDRQYLPFQRTGIAFAIVHKRALIADDMGLGKTIQAIGLINNSTVTNVIIVCPASLLLNWQDELQRWLTRALAVSVFPCTSGAIVLISYNLLAKLGDALCPGLVILDEAHYIKNPAAARTKAVKRLCGRAVRVLALTGTPVLNRPVELWPLLQILDSDAWDPAPRHSREWYLRYVYRYCNAHMRTFGYGLDVSGHSRLFELHTRLFNSCVIRRLKSDVGLELPSKIRQVIRLAVDEQRVEEGTSLEDLRQRLEYGPLSVRRHAQALAKVPDAAVFIKDQLESVEKILVFAHHTDVIAELYSSLATAFDCAVLTITGETSQVERHAIVELFQHNRQYRVIVASIMAAGMGLTLTAASHVIFVERDWTPAVITQAEDRVHRIGQTQSVLVQHLVWGGIDEYISRMLIAKQKVLDAILVQPGNAR